MGKEETNELREEALGRLNQSRKRLLRLQRGAARYGGDDPAPYGPTAAVLEQQLKAAWGAHEELSRLQKELGPLAGPAHTGGRLAQLQTRLVEPYQTRKLSRRAGRFLEAVQSLDLQVEQAGRTLEELEKKPLSVAARCRELHRTADRLAPLSRELGAAGLEGATFEKALDETGRLVAALGQLPGYFHQGTEARILEEASKEITIQAWQVLDRIESPLQQHVDQLEDWRKALDALASDLANLRSVLATAKIQVDRVPDGVDVQGMVLELAQLAAEARRLQEEARALVAEQLPSFGANVWPLVEQARDLSNRAASLPQQLARFQALVFQADELLGSIQRRMDEASAFPEYPIDWEGMWEAWEKLATVRFEAGKTARRRTPERLLQDTETIERLGPQLGALSGQVELVCQQRDGFRLLLQRPELAAPAAWLTRAQELTSTAMEYAGGNWRPALAMPRLYSDAQELNRRRQEVLLRGSKDPLPASRLGALVAQVTSLLEELGRFQGRLEQAAKEMAALQRAEQTALQELGSLSNALEKLVETLRNAQPPLSSKMAGRRGELEYADHEGKRLISRFGQRQTETVERKVQDLHRWKDSCQVTLEALLELLTKERKSTRGELQNEIDQILLVGRLDLQEAMIKARQVLRPPPAEPRLSLGPTRDLRPRDVASLITEVSRLLTDRAQLLMAHQRLRKEVIEPLARPRKALEDARSTALSEFASLSNLKRDLEGGWPPLTCDLTRPKALLDQAEALQGRLPERGRSVSEVRDVWGKMVDAYGQATGEMQARKGQIDREFGELKGLADQLDRWRRQLGAYQRAHSGDKETTQAIGSRIARIDASQESLVRQWEREPPSFREAKTRIESVMTSVYYDVRLPGSNQVIRIREIEASSR